MTDWENYETGPFCRHWGDPDDCDEVCKNCGHSCTQHGANDDFWPCMVDGCDCERWVESE